MKSIAETRLREIVHQYLGDYIEEVIVSYFKSLIREAEEDSVYAFMSRKGFCLYEIMLKCGYIDERPSVTIVSDRYLHKITDWVPYLDKRFFVIDDTVTVGARMKDICDLLTKNGIANIIPCAVFVCELFDNAIGLPQGINCADVVPAKMIHEYTFRIMRLLDATATPFTMDLPVYHANLNKRELDALQRFPEESRSEVWESSDMPVNMTDNEGQETNFAFRFRRPNAGLNFLFEGIRITYCRCTEDSFIVRLIPVVIFDRVEWETAKNYLSALTDAASSVSGAEFIEMNALFDGFDINDQAYVQRLHKTLPYILALRISQQFFKDYKGASFAFDKDYERYHFPESLAKEMEILRNLDLSALDIPGGLTLDEDIPPQENNSRFDTISIYKAAEDDLGKALYQIKQIDPSSGGGKQALQKPSVSLTALKGQLYARFGRARESADAAGLASLCSTLRSSSSYSAKIEGEYMCKYAYSGENSFYAIRGLLPYYWGLYSFALLSDDLSAFRERIDSFTEAFQESFPISDSKAGLLDKVKDWARQSKSLRDIADLWAYLSDKDYHQFSEELDGNALTDPEMAQYIQIRDWVFHLTI